MKPTPAFPSRIGSALKRRRDFLDITQQKVAAEVGMERSYYSDIERGLKRIRIDTLEKICLALQSRPWEILKDADR